MKKKENLAKSKKNIRDKKMKKTNEMKVENTKNEHIDEDMEDQDVEMALEDANEPGMAAQEVDDSAISDSDEDEDDDDEGKEEDEGFSESDLKPPKANKHYVFDDEETFEDLLIPVSLGGKESMSGVQEESDSDAPPEEESISGGKGVSIEDPKANEEILRLKKKVKEARRLQHEKNREQQMKKRKRMQELEERRLPEALLEAVLKEEEKVVKTFAIAKPQGKRKIFDEQGKLSTIIDKTKKSSKKKSKPVDKEEVITLERGVKVQPVQEQVKKHQVVANIAADFRQKALHGRNIVRTTSIEQRQMLVKQKKSGKSMLVS